MGKHHKQVSAFNLEGNFSGFEIEDGYKIKRLRLETAEGEFTIKLTKEARVSIGRLLAVGDRLHVFGKQTMDLETGEVKLKAYLVLPIRPTVAATPIPLFAPAGLTFPAQPKSPATPPTTKTNRATILVCQKSDCMKRGGRAVCAALEQGLRDRNLTGQVTIKGTGCMKECKMGPNLVVMPGKVRYSRIDAREVSTLLNRHFPTTDAQDEQETNPAEVPFLG
jgi:(2Fe-2S) ferredoxin